MHVNVAMLFFKLNFYTGEGARTAPFPDPTLSNFGYCEAGRHLAQLPICEYASQPILLMTGISTMPGISTG